MLLLWKVGFFYEDFMAWIICEHKIQKIDSAGGLESGDNGCNVTLKEKRTVL